MLFSQRLSGFSINGNPFTIPFLCNKFRPPKLRCPNLKCHNQFSSFYSLWNVSCVTAAILAPFLQICSHFEREHYVPCHLHMCNAFLAWWFIHEGAYIIFQKYIVAFLNEPSNSQKVTLHTRHIVYI